MKSALAVLLTLMQLTLPQIDEIVEVRVMNFDIVVTDAAGNHVSGLTKEDFEVYEAGERQEVTNLSEIRVPERLAEEVDLPPRRIVVFVDALSTDTFARKRALTAVAGFLKDHLRPTDEAMVALWNRTLEVTVAPTADHAALEKGLLKAASVVSAGRIASILRERTTGAEAATRSRMYAGIARQETAATANAVNGMLAKMAGTDGRKVMILVTEGFSTSPSRDGADPELEEEMIDPDDARAGSVIVQVARNANAAGVTLYALYARGLESGVSVEDRSAAAASQRVQRGDTNSVEGLRILADRTGGMAASNSNDFRGAFQRISRDLSSYYSLGYRVRSARVDRERKVQIRTRDKSLTVRTRQSIVERSFETEVGDQVVANLFFPGASNQLGIDLVVAARKGSRLPVDVRIPMAGLTLQPFGDDYSADVTVFVASADMGGPTSAVEQFRRRIPVKRAELAQLTDKHYTYGLDIELKSKGRRNRLGVAVLDNVSKMTGFAVADVK